jgi:membrane-bound ClpP family serine protease
MRAAEKSLWKGEYWSATSDTFVNKGEPVQIIAVEGLTVKVKPET